MLQACIDNGPWVNIVPGSIITIVSFSPKSRCISISVVIISSGPSDVSAKGNMGKR